MSHKFQYPPYTFNKNSGYCRIKAIECFLPELSVANHEIVEKLSLKINPTLVETSFGVNSRRIADKNLSDTDLLVQASEKAFHQTGISPEKVSKIIVNKFFGDRILPMTASYLQSKLGIKKAVHSFDIDGGLNSYFQSLDFCSRIPIPKESPVLIASGGIHNRLVTKKDARHAFLFGDGACATIIEQCNERHFLASYQITNASYCNLSQSMSFNNRPTLETFHNDQEFFYDLYSTKNWSVASEFVEEASMKAKNAVLMNSELSEENIDAVILGCFNKCMEDAVIKGMGIQNSKTFSSLHTYGNTMSATLPLALHEALKNGNLKKNSNILIATVGEGISIGTMIYRI